MALAHEASLPARRLGVCARLEQLTMRQVDGAADMTNDVARFVAVVQCHGASRTADASY